MSEEAYRSCFASLEQKLEMQMERENSFQPG